VINRPDGAALLAAASKRADALGALKDGWNGFSILHTAASRVAGLDLGFVNPKGMGVLAGAEAVYLLGADEFDMQALGHAFVIYQGTHGDAGAHRADVILPAAAYTEKSATYVNIEGRAQMTAKAAFPPGEAKEDWTIIRALSAACGETLPFDTLQALRAEMYQAAPQLARLGQVTAADPAGVRALAAGAGPIGGGAFAPSIHDFYLTNPIARASAIMAELSLLSRQNGAPRRQAAE
jgi:NADH-quinone oxidoreductase subunit G